MSDTIATDVNLTGILKRNYLPGLQRSIREDVPFMKFAEEASVSADGEGLYVDVELGLNPASAARDPDGYIPDAGVPLNQQGKLSPVLIETPFVISNTLVAKSKRDKVSFARGLENIMENARLGTMRTINRAWTGDGKGVLATVSGTVLTSAAIVPIDNRRYLIENLPVDIWRSNTLVVAGATILTVDTDTQITMSQNVSAQLAANDVIIRAGNAYLSGGVRTSYEPNGINSICDDGTNDPTGGFMSINPTTYSAWRAIIIDAGSAPMHVKWLAKLLARMRRYGPGKPDSIWTSLEQSWALPYGGAGIYADVRWNSQNTGELGKDGSRGNQVFTIAGKAVKIYDDPDMQPTDFYCFEAEKLVYGELTPMDLEVLAGDGQRLVIYSDANGQKLAQKGVVTWRGNLGAKARNAFGRLKSLALPDGAIF